MAHFEHKLSLSRIYRAWWTLFVCFSALWIIISCITCAVYSDPNPIPILRSLIRKQGTIGGAELDQLLNVVPIREDLDVVLDLPEFGFWNLQWVRKMRLDIEPFSAIVHKKDFEHMWEDIHNSSYFFYGVNRGKLPRALPGNLFSTAMQLHAIWQNNASISGNLTEAKQKRYLMRIVSLKHLQMLKKSDRPVTVLALNEDKMLNYSFSPIKFHGNLVCEALVYYGMNRSLVSRARAEECILQQKERLGVLNRLEYVHYNKLLESLDIENRFHPSSITVISKVIIDRSGFITFGNAFSKRLKYHLQPINECEFRVRLRNPKFGEHLPRGVRLNKHSKVLVASKLYVWSLYHDYVETVCRILPYLKDLEKHTDVKIHVGSIGLAKKVLQTLFGIETFPSSRFISGAVKADIALFPTPSESCYFPGAFYVNLFRDYINQYLSKQNFEKCDHILVIKRSKDRQIPSDQFNRLITALQQRFGSSRVKIFDDQSIPPITELWILFHSASAIIAPHGMGLANIVACRPKTLIIEMLAYDMPTLCFAKLAQSLDLSYHGITTSRNDSHTGTISVNIPAILHLINL